MPSTFQPVYACVEVALKAIDVTGQALIYNVLHFQTASPIPTGGDVNTAITAVTAWINSAYKMNFSSDFTIIQLRGKSLAAAVAPFQNNTVSVQGTQGASDEYAHAPLITLHGALSERVEAGRFYGFPFGGTQTQTGYSAIGMTNLVNALINLKGVAATYGIQLGIASKQRGQCFQATGFGVTNRLTMQKRRRIGFGR